ncbi:MAG: hypothetical protein PF542_04185 [Nanoarchaeota archaeon]|jgi:hypothetical protein|nr:hypothetical protein [Nanoarchaeota archaeon]
MIEQKRQRKTIEEIKANILDFLKIGPKAEKEISDKIQSNWATTNKVLESLKEDNSISEVSSNSKAKYYKRSDDPVFYSLPFSEDVRSRTLALMKDISDTWKEQTKENISKTSLQKIAVKIIKENPDKFNLPIMKFHYGQVASLRYNDSIKEKYNILKLNPSQHKIVLDYVQKNKAKKTYELVQEQYDQKGMELFKAKNDLLDYFKSGKEIDNKIIELSAYFPNELVKTYELFEKFEYASVNLLNLVDPKEKKEYQNRIEQVFHLLWDSITTEYFFFDSESFIEEPQKKLFDSIKNSIMGTKISNISPMIEDLVSEAESKEDNEIKMNTSDKSKELLHLLLSDL